MNKDRKHALGVNIYIYIEYSEYSTIADWITSHSTPYIAIDTIAMVFFDQNDILKGQISQQSFPPPLLNFFLNG